MISLDLETRMALLLSNSKSERVANILSRLKVSNHTQKRCLLLHSIINLHPKLQDIRVYRKVISSDVKSHLELNKALDYQFENIERALQYPYEVSQIIDGNWLMQRTGLPPGITLGKLKDWLFRIQIEREDIQMRMIWKQFCVQFHGIWVTKMSGQV